MPEKQQQRQQGQRQGQGESREKGEKKTVRKSLFQRMVEQEQAEENRVVVAAVRLLGERGMLGGLLGE